MVISGLAKSQRGAAAIEAALVFTLFFALFYAIISYSMPMIMMQAFNHAAASAARSAVAVDPAAYPDTDSYIQTGVIPRVRSVAGNALNWLPTTANDAVLGDNNANIQVAFDHASGVLTVTIVYPQYSNSPLMPTIRLPIIGKSGRYIEIPQLPQDLRGMASVSL